MKLLRHRSLAAQITVVLSAALLVAQFANFALILNERQKLSLARVEGPAIDRFAGVATDLATAASEFRPLILSDASHRGARYAIEANTSVVADIRDATTEERLQQALTEASLQSGEIRVGTINGRLESRRGKSREGRLLLLSVQQPGGQWLNARIAIPPRDPWLIARLGVATLFLYLIVLGATLWLVWRIARPLRDLAAAADSFGGRTAPSTVQSSGPEDVRRAIDAFNAMNQRLVILLDEKDRMLGAIGHDLRTPLASIRIRIEGMGPDEERQAVVRKIDEMTELLESILDLARAGRARENAVPVDISALAESMVEDFRELGRDVSFVGDGRHIAPVQQALVRRAIGNLIDNAIKYGERATVTITETAEAVMIRVADEGPGIAAEDHDKVLRPFYRLETSRNRDLGGSGLGLSIASSVAQAHGGTLTLSNGDTRGLIAELSLPK